MPNSLPKMQSPFKIGSILVQPDRNILSFGDQRISLEPKIMDTLCVLAASPSAVLSREQIIARVWNIEYGGDESLTRAISLLRKAIEAGGGQRRDIQTISKRGYRLAVTPVSVSRSGIQSRAVPAPPQPQTAAETTPAAVLPETAPVRTMQTRDDEMIEQYQAERSAALAPARPRSASPPSKPRASADQPLRKMAFVLLPALIVLIAWPFLRPGEHELSTATFGAEVPVGYGRSVAVLPFDDNSGAQSHAYTARIIADEITLALGTLPDLRVAGRTATANVKQLNLSTFDIGRALNSTHIIDGMISQQGDTVRTIVQLIDTRDGNQSWSKSYQGNANDMFGLQKLIAADILSEIKIVLGIGFFNPIDLDIPQTTISTTVNNGGD